MKDFFRKYSILFAFLVRCLLLYLIWTCLYLYFIAPNKILDLFLINHIISTTQLLLSAMRFVPFYAGKVVGITGTAGLFISPACDGLNLMALFAGFIIAFPGKLRSKLWFIPLGILLIDALNVLRIVLLSLILLYKPSALAFNHSYTFTLVVYVVIFLLWLFWMKHYSKLASKIISSNKA